MQLLDVRVEFRTGLPRRDEAVPRLTARVPHGVPEAVALHIAVCTGERCEPRLAGGLPVDILDVEPLGRILGLVVRVEHDVAGLVEDGQLDVAHGAASDLSRGIRSGAKRITQGS